MTSSLVTAGYWASYNVATFADVRKVRYKGRECVCSSSLSSSPPSLFFLVEGRGYFNSMSSPLATERHGERGHVRTGPALRSAAGVGVLSCSIAFRHVPARAFCKLYFTTFRNLSTELSYSTVLFKDISIVAIKSPFCSRARVQGGVTSLETLERTFIWNDPDPSGECIGMKLKREQRSEARELPRAVLSAGSHLCPRGRTQSSCFMCLTTVATLSLLPVC